jgi:hypothetical protein
VQVGQGFEQATPAKMPIVMNECSDLKADVHVSVDSWDYTRRVINAN